MAPDLSSKARKSEIFSDIERRRKVWAALSELWVLYESGAEDWFTRTWVPAGLGEDETHQYVSQYVFELLQPLNYSAEKLEQIFIYEVNTVMFEVYLLFGIRAAMAPLGEVVSVDPSHIEEGLHRRFRLPFYFQRARLYYRLFGNRWPVGPRWRYLQQLLQDRDQQAKESSEQD